MESNVYFHAVVKIRFQNLRRAWQAYQKYWICPELAFNFNPNFAKCLWLLI